MSDRIVRCECCGRPLRGRAVMLELDQRDGTYHNFEDVPDDRSQGWFPFGASCAKREIGAARAARLHRATRT